MSNEVEISPAELEARRLAKEWSLVRGRVVRIKPLDNGQFELIPQNRPIKQKRRQVEDVVRDVLGVSGNVAEIIAQRSESKIVSISEDPKSNRPL